MRLALLFVLLLGVACSSDKPPMQDGPDAGRGDAGTGTDDAGTRTDDAGSGDAGCEPLASGPGTPLLTGLNTPRRLAADATDLYIAESHSLNPQQPQPGPGRLLRLPRAGGDAVSVATGFRAPDAIAVVSDSVYVLDLDGLWRVDKATGAKDARPLDATVNNVTIGGTDVLPARMGDRDVVVIATSHRRLVRVDASGGNRQELYAGTGYTQVRGARVVGQDVWFLVAAGESPGLYSVPLDGSAPATLRDGSITAGTSLEVTPTHFLVTEGGGGNGRVLRLPREGGAAEVVATGLQGPAFPVELNGTLYFKDVSTGGTGFLRRVSTCTPGALEPVGPEGVGPGGLLVDGDTLLFTSQESGTGGFVGRVP
ncbi:signal integration modulator SinM [Myxococcus xanthus]|uniref:Signal integration modulator SinM n=1 Tax=Myxococcus xanthus TaxID=34 RepID=A0A7Y4MPF7_MYXXA|nr:signal integration modulator SinM [Myxococcus xanthus]NOJ77369.1 signal integration modulator SinM [Myxococcus xanthus]NOJ84608.1 signal integration modulator SinM [Myxococcus xanthus]